MPSIISNIFQPQQEGEQASAQTTTLSGDGGTVVDTSPSVGIELAGSYQDADGNTHEWSNDTSIGTNVNLAAATGVTGSLANEDMSGLG